MRRGELHGDVLRIVPTIPLDGKPPSETRSSAFGRGSIAESARVVPCVAGGTGENGVGPTPALPRA